MVFVLNSARSGRGHVYGYCTPVRTLRLSL